MRQINKCVDKLIAVIQQSEEYRRYLEIREKIKLEPEKERAIQNYRKQVFEVNARSGRGEVDMLAEVDRLEKEFASFRRQPLVEEYIQAELAICRLIQKINLRIMQEIEFDGFWNQ